jgi:hypothetical protein
MPSFWRKGETEILMRKDGKDFLRKVEGIMFGPFLIHENEDDDGDKYTLTLMPCKWAVVKGLSEAVLKKMAMDLHGTGDWLKETDPKACSSQSPKWVGRWIRKCLLYGKYHPPEKDM